MLKDAAPNGDAPESWPGGSRLRVSEMQAKLHRWAVADPGRRFDGLFNFVYDPATLLVAFDRVVQAALKLVLEPIFEADFEPVSYGFRPKRRAHDAIAEIHHFGTRGYRWVLDADIEAAFDNLSHSFAMERVWACVKDKRVLALVKAFLKSGVLTELGEHRETFTGTPQGGILSPLIFNIALSALDEHVMEPWKPGGVMSTLGKRSYRRSRGRPTWRIVRYADDCAPRTLKEAMV